MQLPKGTRLYHKDWFERIVVVEHPPTCRTVVVDTNPYQYYTISIPWTVYVICLTVTPLLWLKYPEKIRMFFRNSPLETCYDRVAPANLANISSDGRVCLGTATPFRLWWSVKNAAESMIERVWQSRFTFQGVTVPTRMITNFEQWHKATQENQNFAGTLDWETMYKSCLGFYLGDYFTFLPRNSSL